MICVNCDYPHHKANIMALYEKKKTSKIGDLFHLMHDVRVVTFHVIGFILLHILVLDILLSLF